MAANKALIDGVQNTVTTAVDLYTSPAQGNGTRITAFTASLDAGAQRYSVFIGLTATTAKRIIQLNPVSGPGQDSPLELINHFIPAGQKLFVQVSTGTTITIRASGIEF
jgi:hypothetical protein